MENASRALLMAGGILAGILVITALAIMWSKMSGAKASQSGNVKTEQLAEFNAAFDSYANETVMGTDIISLFNRVNSYDKNLENDVLLANIQYEHIKICITDLSNSQYESEFGTVLGIKNGSENDIAKAGTQTYDKIKKYIQLENDVGKDNMNKLSSYYGANNGDQHPFTNATYDVNGQPTNIVAQVKQEQPSLNGENLRKAVIRRYLGKTLSIYPEDADIRDYYIYTSFKITKFTCTDILYSPDNGQVSRMNFVAKK